MRRFPLAYDFADHDQLVAEHGFSALVTVESGGRAWRERKVTFPTGAELHLPPPSRADLEAVNVLHNARRLTGRDRIVGFVGGFHLTGAAFEAISVGTTPRF